MSRQNVGTQIICNDEDYIVEIYRPGRDGSRYIKPARTVVDMQKWCEVFNKDSGKGIPEGTRCPTARVIHRSEKKEFADN